MLNSIIIILTFILFSIIFLNLGMIKKMINTYHSIPQLY